MTIPPVIHFCWIGSDLPWAYAFAPLSAAARSELPDIVLHHTDPLADTDPVRALRATPGIRLHHLDPLALLRETGERLALGDRLAALYARLADPVKRADVLRAAILHATGGIYADLDTITVASLRPLLEAQAFVGAERIVWPAAARTSRSPARLARAVALDLLRKLCRACPGGWRLFRHVQRLYVPSVNNAIMGAAPGAPLMADYLRAMVELAPARQQAPYGLGPHLLATVVGRAAPGSVAVHDPATFYPLAPEISEHWFREQRRTDLARMLSPETRIVHWYASVRTRARLAAIDPVSITRNRQPYSALVRACVPL